MSILAFSKNDISRSPLFHHLTHNRHCSGLTLPLIVMVSVPQIRQGVGVAEANGDQTKGRLDRAAEGKEG